VIFGTVNAKREALIQLRVRGPSAIERDVEFVVDTGFNSTLALPKSIALWLGLLQLGQGHATLADGSTQQYEIYLGQYIWDGTLEECLFTVVGEEALLGMGLLEGHEFRMEVKSDGLVEITRLP